MIAALFVAAGGCYFGLPGVDPWPESRDARLYAGPWPVVAHPPCERWGRYWSGGPSARVRRVKGDDDGCFKAALDCVRAYGGVLEHPADSAARETFGLKKPDRGGGWRVADYHGGRTCCVDQGHYGHRAKKTTWLYACQVETPELQWGASAPPPSVNSRPQSLPDGRRASRTGICQRMSRRQRRATPIPFRDLLLSIARTARGAQEAA